MLIVKRVTRRDGSLYGFRLECPGCKAPHVIPVKPTENGWDWNGSETAPTFSPSLLVYEHRIPDTTPPENVVAPFKPGDVWQPRCHSFIRDGKWQFLSDCGHALAGQTVDMIPIPDTER